MLFFPPIYKEVLRAENIWERSIWNARLSSL